VADHRVIESIYFRDPNGYVSELTSQVDDYDSAMQEELRCARGHLERWQRSKD
jgi:hypothetical protein